MNKILVKIISFFIKNHNTLLNFSQNDSFSVLVVSNTALGDTILSTPAIKSLKKSFPNAKIIALISKKMIPLFKNHLYIDILIPYYGGYKHFFYTISKIRKHKPKLGLILHGNSPQDIHFCLFSGCKNILKLPTSHPLKKYLSHQFVQKKQHTIEDRLDLIRFLGGKKLYKDMNLSNFNDKNKIDKYKKFKDTIGFQIGAADTYKMWQIQNFITLAKKIIEYDKSTIVITGIQKESPLAKKISDEIGKNIINMCGKCHIEELPYLVQNFKRLITNDTGTMHLAIALKIPTICLFSPTDSNGIGPYQDKNLHKIIQKNGSFIQKIPKKQRSDEAMKLISADEVFDTYRKMDKDENMYV